MLPFENVILVVGQNSGWQNTYNLESLNRGEVTRVSSVLRTPAGKGSNVVRGIEEAGLESTLLAYVGGETGKKFAESCLAEGLTCEFVWIGEETRSFVTLVEDDGTVSEIIEPSPGVTVSEREEFSRRLTLLLEKADILLIQGTAMQGEDPECYCRYIESAKQHRVPCALDSFKEHGRLALAACPDILKINDHEIRELTGSPFSSEKERAVVFSRVHRDYDISWVIVTVGEKGVIGSDGNEIVSVRPPAVDMVNNVGSGDAFSAGLGVSLQKDILRGANAPDFPRGFSFQNALSYGTAMGTANCLTLQPGRVNKEDVQTLLDQLVVHRMR